jgi:hypothetical protein
MPNTAKQAKLPRGAKGIPFYNLRGKVVNIFRVLKAGGYQGDGSHLYHEYGELEWKATHRTVQQRMRAFCEAFLAQILYEADSERVGRSNSGNESVLMPPANDTAEVAPQLFSEELLEMQNYNSAQPPAAPGKGVNRDDTSELKM